MAVYERNVRAMTALIMRSRPQGFRLNVSLSAVRSAAEMLLHDQALELPDSNTSREMLDDIRNMVINGQPIFVENPSPTPRPRPRPRTHAETMEAALQLAQQLQRLGGVPPPDAPRVDGVEVEVEVHVDPNDDDAIFVEAEPADNPDFSVGEAGTVRQMVDIARAVPVTTVLGVPVEPTQRFDHGSHTVFIPPGGYPMRATNVDRAQLVVSWPTRLGSEPRFHVATPFPAAEVDGQLLIRVPVAPPGVAQLIVLWPGPLDELPGVFMSRP
jgi:hypothetical protein